MPAADRQIAGTTPRNGRPAPGVTRRLSAILVADLAGYTEHMRENEASAHKLVRSDFKTILLPKIRSGHGRVVKTMGDGLLAEFASVVDCVECAIAIQEAVAAKNETLTSGTRFQYRIAVNLGDIIIDGDDIYGDGVNVATRLQAIGSPGSVVVSGDAYRHVKGKLNVEFEDLGDQMVKGVAEPVRVHRVVSARNEPARSIE
jgi:class 3 adenylate cyclase